MSALLAIARVRLQECLRRSFAPVVLIVTALLALASRALLGFAFGAEHQAVANLVLSAGFLAGLLHAALLGTQVLGRDLERGTLALILTKPTHRRAYVCGSFLGLSLSAIIIYGVCSLVVGGLLLLLPGGPAAIARPQLLGACLRGVLAILLLQALALVCSSALPRQAGAPVLILLFVASGMLAPAGLGSLLPDPALFSVETAPGRTPSAGALLLYTVAHGTASLAIAYLVLSFRAPLRGRS
jgi:ABC-type transport system involved in multi-copper enzyme maturation permease subunit